MTAELNTQDSRKLFLARLSAWTTDFIALLELEKTALTAKDNVAVEQLASQKTDALTRLDTVLETGGTADTISKLLSEISELAEESEEARELVKSVRKLRELNRINGQLINRRLTQNRFLMSLLTGQNNNSETYTLQGQTDQGENTVRIGKV